MRSDLIYKAYTVRLREGERESYLAYHREIWPEVEKVLKEAGIEEYKIYITPDDQLFSIIGMKEEDTMERLDRMNAQNETCALWEDIMNKKQTPCDFAENGWAEIDLAYDLSRENREE